jgi:hypothetical protein
MILSNCSLLTFLPCNKSEIKFSTFCFNALSDSFNKLSGLIDESTGLIVEQKK